jgi:inosine triphosphate pyrophosphatase
MNNARAVSSSNNEEDQEAKKVVTFVTGNAKKLEEVKSILKLASTDEEEEEEEEEDNEGGKKMMMKINLISRSIDLPELQGDPIDIAKEKCLLASREIEGPTLVEDTSLCFNALKGLPGPYVKWFLEKTGLDGLNNMLLAYEDKTAYAQCVFAYCEGGEKSAEEVEVFVGRTNGRIVKARGKTEFGWDAVFEPDEQRDVDDKKTYGEMEKEEKNAISHRFRALEKLREAKFR